MPANTFDKAAAFSQLYHASRDRLYNYLRTYSQDKHLLQDLMQQSYLNLWEKIDGIHDLEKALPLLKIIARNLLIDTVRRRMKEDLTWLETIQEEVEQLIVQPAENPTAALRALDTAIAQLPEDCRKVYLLHREEGLSYRQIAGKMVVSVSMVEKHMSKAIRLLKQDLLTNCELVLVIAVANRWL